MSFQVVACGTARGRNGRMLATARRPAPCVVVIDESFVLDELVRDELAGTDVEVVHCARAEDAVGIVAAWQPRIVFIDHGRFGEGSTAITSRMLRRRLARDPLTAHIPVRFVMGASQEWESSLHSSEYVTVPFEEPALQSLARG